MSSSTVFAMACTVSWRDVRTLMDRLRTHCMIPGEELVEKQGVYVGGDDFKSGQTKMNSVLVDFLVSDDFEVCLTHRTRLIVMGYCEGYIPWQHLAKHHGNKVKQPLT